MLYILRRIGKVNPASVFIDCQPVKTVLAIRAYFPFGPSVRVGQTHPTKVNPSEISIWLKD
jgi:hypothetical protein